MMLIRGRIAVVMEGKVREACDGLRDPGDLTARVTIIDMESCWAACLGNCGQKLSGEHLVSASLFMGDTVRVQGFPWCQDTPKVIGLSGLIANILCDRHNNALSPVDEAGAKTFSALREMRRLANVRERLKPRLWNVVKHRLDGRALERWFLKTLINLCCNGDHPIGRKSPAAGRPADELVRIAYGQASFANGAGLYFVVRTGMQIDSKDSVGFSPLIRHGTHIEGGLFSFRGFRFLLWLEGEGPPVPLSGVSILGEDLGEAQLMFRNRQINEYAGKYRSQVLTIDW